MKNVDTTKKIVLIVLIVGEIITVGIVIGLYLLLEPYWSHLTGGSLLNVILGSALGAVVAILNQVLMFVIAEKAFEKISEDRGNNQFTEEEIEQFKKDNGAALKNRMQLSFIARTAVIASVFVLAYLTKAFDILAAVIPLVMLKPLILISEIFQKRK